MTKAGEEIKVDIRATTIFRKEAGLLPLVELSIAVLARRPLCNDALLISSCPRMYV
jgi:hypothetical protein